MITFRTLTIAAAAFSAVIFAVPTASEAMPQPVLKFDAAGSGNLVQVHSRRSCRNSRCHVRNHRYREHLRSSYACPPYYGYYLPRYGADRPCKSYYRPYHGHYKRSGAGLFDFLD